VNRNNELTYSSFDLQTLLHGMEGVELYNADREIRVSGIEYDSRKVEGDSLFVAVEGMETDGHKFVAGAVEAGASAVMVTVSRFEEFSYLAQKGVGIVTAADTRAALSVISSRFFGDPSHSVPVIGITGTNGKTTITYMLESILTRAGYNPGVIGTINYRWSGKTKQAANTTPESRDLHQLMSVMVQDEVNCIIMEVSSHALSLKRADDIAFDYAVFTNLTRDHLDYHHDFDEYFDAKMRLFTLLGKSDKKKKAAFINSDDPYGKRILKDKDGYSYRMYGYGIESETDYAVSAASVQSSITGNSFLVLRPFEKEFRLQMAGRFNIYNSLAAIGVTHVMGLPVGAIVDGLSRLKKVPGRFDAITSRGGFSVVIDYAHTDDALDQLLRSVRALEPARVITVFGCGGNRDTSKRPLMAAASEAHSDWTIITSDNPRKEDPAKIIDDIVNGMSGDRYEVIENREEAIKHAVHMAEKNDIIVIAGKGHEDYQIIGDKKSHFDDREMAQKYISARENV